MWEVCLPASSSSSSPNSRKEQGRLQLRRERESEQAVPAGEGGGAGTGAGGEIQTEQETPTPEPDWDRRTNPDTFSHSGPGPRTPPTLRGHPDTLSQSCQSPVHSRDTHRDPGPHPPQTVWAPDSSQRVERGAEGRKTTGSRGCAAKALEAGVGLPHSFPKTLLSQDNPGHLARGPASFPHSPNHHHRKGVWVLGK